MSVGITCSSWKHRGGVRCEVAGRCHTTAFISLRSETHCVWFRQYGQWLAAYVYLLICISSCGQGTCKMSHFRRLFLFFPSLPPLARCLIPFCVVLIAARLPPQRLHFYFRSIERHVPRLIFSSSARPTHRYSYPLPAEEAVETIVRVFLRRWIYGSTLQRRRYTISANRIIFALSQA